MAAGRPAGDNGEVNAQQRLSRPAWAFDVALAVAATIAAVAAVIAQADDGGAIQVRPVPGLPGHELTVIQPAPTAWYLLGVALTAAPLAFRRRYPVAAFAVLFAAVLAMHDCTTTVTLAAVIVAAYSAVLYSRFRRSAVLAVLAAGLVVTAAFPSTTPPLPARFTALLVLAPVTAVAVAMRGWRQRAGDSAERLRRAQAEHQAQTRRAVEAERARIASELHDVVTHNVSVMLVQAGAARRVLDSSPAQARAALLAVEASGRTAMGELRHMLGLLGGEEEAALMPQPGLGQVPALIQRVRAAGLRAELSVTGARDLPPGLDLAAYRVVQEAVTNVIRHAGAGRAVVSLEHRPADLLITVTDDGRPGARAAGEAGGRGLIGLRERIGLYRGELDAGPRPGGGWQVRARIPVEGPGRPGGTDGRGEWGWPVRSEMAATAT